MPAWGPSQLLDKFAESKTLALAARAKKLMMDGRSIINFGAGEPDFNTPPSIIEAAYRAAKEGYTKYTPVAGHPRTRAAVAKRLSEDYQVSFEADEIVLSTGGKQALFHSFQAILNPGDEVIIPVPYWTSFPEMVKLVGGNPIFVQPYEGRIRAEDIQAAVTSRTRALILNSPSNPSGIVYSDQEVRSYMDAIRNSSAWLISDDTYYTLVYTGKKWVSCLALDPSFRERTLIVGSTSKSYAMTGWRSGWLVAPKVIAAAVTKLQGQVTSNPCTLSQAATEEAVSSSHRWAAEFRTQFEKRRNLMMRELNKLQNVSYMEPEGAFYCFVKLSEALKNQSVTAFCEELLEKHGVCSIPGEAFGMPDYARISYASSEEDIVEGIRRLEVALMG